MNFLNDLFDRLPFSKGFLLVIVVVALFYMSLDDPQVKHDKAIASFENSIEIRKQKVSDSIASLKISDSSLLRCISNAASDRANIPPASSGGIDDARDLELIYCPGSKINSLAGIEELSALRFADFSKNNIQSLAPLANLKQLKNIQLTDNPLKSVSVLKSMPALKEVFLPNMPEVACMDIYRAVQGLKSNYKSIKCSGQRENGLVTSGSGSSVSKRKSKSTSTDSTKLTSSQQQELFEYEREQRYRNK